MAVRERPGRDEGLPVLSLRAALLLLAAGCATTPRSTPVALDVVTYNIHAGTDAARVDNLARVADLIRESGASIVLLQEVDSMTTRSRRTDQLARLATLAGMQGVFGSMLDFQGGAFGLGLLSRFPITSHHVRPYDATPATPRDGSAREPRGALIAVVATPDGPLHVVNTHLDASADSRWRESEATQLAAIVDSLRARGARVIAGGDLNSRPGTPPQAILAAAGLQDAWEVCGRGDGNTFPAGKADRRIDYLYVTPGASCAGATVIPHAASDHLALFASLRLP